MEKSKIEKTLVLVADKNAYYFDRIQNPNIVIDQVFNNKTFFNNVVLKLFRKLRLPFTRLFYRKWYKQLMDYDKIIVFDMALRFDYSVLHNIRRKNPLIEGYFYSWNIVTNEAIYKKERQATDREGFKFFCYDHGNCEKYDLYFNTIMYDINLRLPKVQAQHDAFFLGYLKDRKEHMLALYKEISDAGYVPRFVIVDNGDCQNDLPFELREQYVKYYDYLSMINESRAILDIAQNGQDGFSMRVMEAIFFDKKLITTNKAVKKAPFYNENNILVIELGETTASQIKTFFDKETVAYSKEIKEYYSFEKWIERFE